MSLMMKRRGLLTGAALLAATPRARAAGEVIVGTFGGDYAELLSKNIDKPLLGPQSIEITQILSGQDPRKTKIAAERNARRGSMDVATMSDVDMYIMSQLNVWEPLTPDNVPNLAHVLPALRVGYAVSHIYSGMVLLYNPGKITTPPKGYADMWDPKYKGRVGLSDGLYQHVLAASALVHGGSMSDFEPGKKGLMELKQLQPRIYPSNETLAAGLKSEEVWMTPIWLARGVAWRKSGINISHVVPSEGAIPYMSQAAVTRNAPNKQNALAYVNAMLDPSPQRAFAEQMSYAPTVDNATIPADLMREIGFTPEQQANFKVCDYAYMARTASQMLDFWTKEFTA